MFHFGTSIEVKNRLIKQLIEIIDIEKFIIYLWETILDQSWN